MWYCIGAAFLVLVVFYIVFLLGCCQVSDEAGREADRWMENHPQNQQRKGLV